jgi:hypothetical protein
MHNVLKGARKLSPEIADLLLLRLRMSPLDLLSAEELQDYVLRSVGSLDLLALASVPELSQTPRKPPTGAVRLEFLTKERAS